ncbi:MAG: hypothetical protein FMNOHCHN_03760 [Ignavibacteriaceae bacterium]|nr:hypothetical protein [Ignavibacteriaceae bacterium]
MSLEFIVAAACIYGNQIACSNAGSAYYKQAGFEAYMEKRLEKYPEIRQIGSGALFMLSNVYQGSAQFTLSNSFYLERTGTSDIMLLYRKEIE